MPYVLKSYGESVYKKLHELGMAAGVCTPEQGDQEANPLYPVPRLMTAKEPERVYYQIADWG